MKKLLYILFFLHLILTPLYAQPSITWSRFYDGPQHYYEIAFGMCKSTENSFFISGRTGGETGYLLRINKFGDTIWTKTFSGGLISSICSSGDGGCVFINNLVLKKVDSTGVIVWQKTDTLYVTSYDIIKTTDGGYVVCGIFGYNSKVMRFDSAGNLKWQKEYSSVYYLSFYSIKEALNTGYLVAGTDRGLPTIDTSKSVLLHIDESGNTIWEKRYKIFNRPTQGGIVELRGNEIILGCTIIETGFYVNKTRPSFMVTDTGGNIIYTKVFQGANYCEGLQDLKISNPNRLIFSTILMPGDYCNDSIIAKIFTTDSLGNIFNARCITASQAVELRNILPLSNGDILFSGVLDGSLTYDEDILVIRTDSLLNSPPIGIKSVYSSAPDRFYLYQNYPNPFNPTTKIKYAIPLSRGVSARLRNGQAGRGVLVKLVIYDILGREITVLVNQLLNPGTYEAEFSATGGGSNYPSGVYFYRLTAGEYTECKKMVLIK